MGNKLIAAMLLFMDLNLTNGVNKIRFYSM